MFASMTTCKAISISTDETMGRDGAAWVTADLQYANDKHVIEQKLAGAMKLTLTSDDVARCIKLAEELGYPVTAAEVKLKGGLNQFRQLVRCVTAPSSSYTELSHAHHFLFFFTSQEKTKTKTIGRVFP